MENLHLPGCLQRMPKLVLLALLVGVAMLLKPVHGFAVAVPPNDGYVTDAASILQPAEREALIAVIDEYRRTTSNEIAIVTIPTLAGEDVSTVALEIARKWKVGSSKNNGILILIAYQERTARIEVGYGLEGAVPDLVAKGIIETDIVPAFREAKYADGLTSALQSLQKHIGGEYTADRYATDPAQGIGPYIIFGAFLLFQWLLAIMGRSKSWWLGGVFGGIGGTALVVIFGWWLSIPILILVGLGLDYIVSKNYHRRGGNAWWVGGNSWGGGSSGRGGFGGFGGGGFGGGGASGKW